MTREQIRQFFGGDNCELTLGDLVDLEASANADPEEGQEWLPYYKMAHSRLMEALGCASALASRPNASKESRDKVVREIGRLAYESMLLCGIGPIRDQDHIRRVEQSAAEAMSTIIDSLLGRTGGAV